MDFACYTQNIPKSEPEPILATSYIGEVLKGPIYYRM